MSKHIQFISLRAASLLTAGVRLTRISDNGIRFARGTRFNVNCTLFVDVLSFVETDVSLQIIDDSGTLRIKHPLATPGTKYLGSG